MSTDPPPPPPPPPPPGGQGPSWVPPGGVPQPQPPTSPPPPPGHDPYAAMAAAPAQGPTPVGTGTNAKAIASLVLGIGGFAVCPVIMSVAAVVLGHMARNEIGDPPRQEGKGLALAGLILGYIALALTAILILVIVVLAATGNLDTTTTTTEGF